MIKKKYEKPTLREKKFPIIGAFGPIYYGFIHQGVNAIKHLMKVKKGECFAALHRDDIGDIDLVWGRVTNASEGKGFGLAHILQKHKDTIEARGFKVESFIPIIVEHGEFNPERSGQDKRVFEGNGYRFVVKTVDQYDKPKKWLLTSFDLTKNKKRRKQK